MSKKITKFICFFMAAVMLCSCSPKGVEGMEKGKASVKPGDKTEAAADRQASPGELSWRKTEIQMPGGAAFVSSLNYLADGAMRIHSSDQDGRNGEVWDSRDNGGTWENADADMGLESEYGYHYSAEGSLYIFDTARLAISAGGGTQSKEIRVDEKEMIVDAAMAGNTLAVLVLDQNSLLRLDIYDLDTMSCRTPENGELSQYLNSQSVKSIALSSSGEILYLMVEEIKGTWLARYDLNQDQLSSLADQDTMSRLLNREAENGLVNPREEVFQSFAVNDAEDRIALCMMDLTDSRARLYLCEKGVWGEEKKTASGGSLRIYSLHGGHQIRQAASLFQEMHPELEVSFETGYTGEDGVTLSDAIRTLNTELMAGEGPDLLVLDGLPEDSYAEKGILEDLTDIVEPEKEKYFYNIISSYNGGGKICKVPTAFSVPVILGDEETLAAENLDELMDVFERKADAGIPFITPKNFAGTAGSLFLTSDILRETVDEGKLADFYRDLEKLAAQSMSDEERQAMEDYDRMTYWAENYPSGCSQPELELYFGEAQAGTDKFSTYEDYTRVLAVRREKGLSYQYLNREKGNYFIAESVLGINSTGKNPEAARQFLTYYLSGEAQESEHFSSFSVIRSVMEGRDHDRYISESGESIGGISRKNTPDKMMNLNKITPAELQELIAFLEGCSRPVGDDLVVLQKVMEQADACLFEGKDPESAAKEVCSEVNLYLSE